MKSLRAAGETHVQIRARQIVKKHSWAAGASSVSARVSEYNRKLSNEFQEKMNDVGTKSKLVHQLRCALISK